MEKKVCKKCQLEKPRSEFYSNGPQGYPAAKCKPCALEDSKQSRKDRRDRVKAAGGFDPDPDLKQLRCETCGDDKLVDCFTKSRQHKSGYCPRCRACQKALRELRRDAYQSTRLKKSYGIDLQQKMELLRQQGGVCAICSIDSPGVRGWMVDHDHETSRIRGILCLRCNAMLGHAKDRPEVLRMGADYLGRR